ncbi:hypothetical protein CI109_101798 [Kwoniella shandongensis]|uniref:Uncharacterized protein n=1 Tax=Kwoniella shandongensis TaxID=1734106 RepID=A0A5M6C6B9_9TREE|nr:uncharacterized protein CI109_001080 [Kwoniella shandongensis]KAA5530280.1 hypothetical protein CI109_001080 [Kwoniella shandongensis]
MSLESPANTPPATQTTFDARLAYLRSNSSYSQPAASSSRSFHNAATHQRQSSTSSATLLNPSMPSHPGCVLCSRIRFSASRSQAASPAASPSPRTAFLPSTSGREAEYHQPFESARSLSPAPVVQPRSGESGNTEYVYQDRDVTAFRAEGKERLCSNGKHLIIAINRHVENVYDLGPADVPILGHILETARRILLSSSIEAHTSSANDAERGKGKAKDEDVRVGFVGTVVRDPQSPHAHLHAHALLGPIDTSLPGASFWRRNVVFGGVNWWSVEDLIAEIRESTSNNRVKSGYQHRGSAPIDRVLDAGSVEGLPNAMDPDQYQDVSPPNSAPVDQSFPNTSAKASSSASSHAPSDTRDSNEDGYVAVDLEDAKGVARGGRI